jgi:hypothetical protein
MVNEEMIILSTGGGTCELSSANFFKEALKDSFGILVETPLFYFNRIKSRIESQGHGTVMMERLVQICDEKGLTVINELNPYGRMKINELKAWFEKYGFQVIKRELPFKDQLGEYLMEADVMIRHPKVE